LVAILAYCGLGNSQPFCYEFLLHPVVFDEFTGYHCS
jgi:hypothetical protein